MAAVNVSEKSHTSRAMAGLLAKLSTTKNYVTRTTMADLGGAGDATANVHMRTSGELSFLRIATTVVSPHHGPRTIILYHIIYMSHHCTLA